MNTSHEQDEWGEIQTLVLQAVRGEGVPPCQQEQVANRLLARLRPHVYQIVRGVCFDLETAEDITQEVMLRVWQYLPRYDPSVAPFRAWLSQVAINCAYDALQRKARIRRHELLEDEGAPCAVAHRSLAHEHARANTAFIDDVAERERLERILNLARTTLSHDEYLVWLEHTVNRLPHRKIAKLLSRSEVWARQILLRARQKLAAAIILSHDILTDEEIHTAIERCQRSTEPLTPQELRLVQACISQGRHPPPWRFTVRFRRACAKLLPHL